MSTKTQQQVEQTSNTLHHALDSVSAAARPTVDQITAGVHGAIDKLSATASRTAETLDAKTQQLREAQARAAENARTQVRDRPLTALAVAVGTGFLLSWLFNQRK